MGTFWHRLYSACPVPTDSAPVTEDQRYWTCNICGTTWEWAVLDPDDPSEPVGWRKYVPPMKEKA